MKIKKSIFAIICLFAIVILCITSCYRTGSKYFDISDGFVDKYIFEMPYEDFKYDMRLDGFIFAHEEEKISEIKEAVLKKGYIVDEKEIGDETKLIVSLHNGFKKIALFSIAEYGDNPYRGKNWYEVNQLVATRGGCKFPYPVYMLDYVSGLPFSMPKDKDNFDDYILNAKLHGSFDDLLEFYKNSLTEIIEVDDKNRTIIISGIDVKKGSALNSIVKVEVSDVSFGTSHVSYKRLKDYN